MVHILDREDRCFTRAVKQAIYVKVEKPSLNRGGGLRHHLSPIYNSCSLFTQEIQRLSLPEQQGVTQGHLRWL